METDRQSKTGLVDSLGIYMIYMIVKTEWAEIRF